ncbi:unnamed protein product [Prorocentrum cordatum]|uniref:Ion transport domain-containing protein n=1 Tax=Prorocentrum cordatum TaxID=2364126 RepID=A0ABN9U7M5_9DINO|nr:unnamed protein product [Polarella glacialis]
MQRPADPPAPTPGQLSAHFAELRASFAQECARIAGLLDEHALALQALAGATAEHPQGWPGALGAGTPSREAEEPPAFVPELPEAKEPPAVADVHAGPGLAECVPAAPSVESRRISADSAHPAAEPLGYVPGWLPGEPRGVPGADGEECAPFGCRAWALDDSQRASDVAARSTAEDALPTPPSPQEGPRGARHARRGTKDLRLARDGTMEARLARGATWFSSRDGSLRASRMTRSTDVGGEGAFFDAKAYAKNAEVTAWEGEYDEANLYKEDGTAQWLARHPAFTTVQFIVVALNIIWIGIETDYNDKEILYEADAAVQLVENLFCLFFLWDWIVRLCAFRYKCDSLGDFWFMFDSVLLVMMVFETWVLLIAYAVFRSDTSSWPTNLLRLVRLLRFTRSARIARLLRSIPELTVIIKGLMVVTRTVILIIVLLTMFVYVFAILFVQFFRDLGNSRDAGNFDDIPSAMATLCLGGLIPDMAPMTYAIADENLLYGAVFMLFVLLGAFAIMNMLIGVLVQVVGVVATVEEETYQLKQVKNIIIQNRLHLNEDDAITMQDVEALFSDAALVGGFRQVGIDTDDLLNHSKDIFRGRTDLNLHAVWQLAVQHRGDCPVKVKDLVHLRQFIRSQVSALVEQVHSLGATTSAVQANPPACIAPMRTPKSSVGLAPSDMHRESLSDRGRHSSGATSTPRATAQPLQTWLHEPPVSLF